MVLQFCIYVKDQKIFPNSDAYLDNPLLGQSLLPLAGTANPKIFDKLTSDQDPTYKLIVYQSWFLVMFDVGSCSEDIVTPQSSPHYRDQCNGGTIILPQSW